MRYHNKRTKVVTKNKLIVPVVFLTLLIIMFIALGNGMNSYVYASIENNYTIEAIEEIILRGELEQHHYLNIFPKVVDVYGNGGGYSHYLNGVWLSHNREYENALKEFAKVLELVKETPDLTLEMITLEKVLEINEVYGDLIAYQSNAFRLRELSAGENDKLYVKALFAIANAHYQTYDDDVARSYLSILYGEATRIDYSLGISLYHFLYGDIEFSYNNYDDAKYHYQKAYAYAIGADNILGYSYNKFLEIQMATIDSTDGNIERAYERIGMLLENIDRDSESIKRDVYYEYGKMSVLLERYEEAIKYYQLALINDYLVNKAYESYSFSAVIYTELGFAYAELNRFEESVGYFEKAYEVANFKDSDEIISEQVSALNSYEVDELEREIAFKKKLRAANEATIALQQDYLRIGLGLIAALILSLIGMLYMIYRKNRVQKKLYLESITDHLTKVFNRGYIISVLEENKLSTSCVLMMDVDDFKMINDTLGHVVGDKVLIRVADVIEKNLRDGDSVGRYGGEEFLVILRNTTLEKGLLVAERIRSAIEHLEWEEEIVTTISIGMMLSHDVDTDELLTEADILMYRAKRLGKNRVVF